MDTRGNEVVLDIDEGERAFSHPPCPVPAAMVLCRICHEEEEESGSSMEKPCACSGTLEFAHRRCVQRWCDEKESTLCEICLQNFEPNYTVAPKKALIEVGVTIRQSIEVTALEGYGLSRPPVVPTLFEGDHQAAECSPASRRNINYLHAAALTLTVLLLLRHLISVVKVSGGNHAFTVFTASVLRVVGFLLLLYAFLRAAYILKELRAMMRREQRAPLSDDVEDLENLSLREGSHLAENLGNNRVR